MASIKEDLGADIVRVGEFMWKNTCLPSSYLVVIDHDIIFVTVSDHDCRFIS